MSDRVLWPRRRVLTVGAAGVVGAGLAAGAAFWRPSKPAPQASRLPAATAPITRMTLRDIRSVPGTLAYGLETILDSPLEGMVTWLPDPGTTIEQGQTLARIDDLPIILLYGSLPAYRELASATRGADVKQLEENLRALGHLKSVADLDYTEATAQAVRKLQKAAGLEQTGAVELGRIYYADGPIRVAAHNVAKGQKVPGQVYRYTATARMVTAQLKPHQQDLAKKGTAVTIALASGQEIEGRVEGGQMSNSPDSGPAFEAVVALVDPKALAGVDDGPVSVRFKVGERPHVLVVPVAALLALAEGGYGLEVVEGDSTRIVAVETGLFAGGNVEVSGSSIAEGMIVGMAP